MILTLIFWLVGLVIGVLMFLRAYGWGWQLWKCVVFAVVMLVAAVLALGLCKSLVIKLIGKLGSALAAVGAKLG